MQTIVSRFVFGCRQCFPSAGSLGAVALLSGLFTTAFADDGQGLRLGPSFWSIDAQSSAQRSDDGAALLRPPASWSWDSAPPRLDFAAGLEQHFSNGLRVSTGISAMEPVQEVAPQTLNYRDYFMGLSYGSLDSNVWYLAETETEPSALYFDAGWQQAVQHDISVSVRLGQYASNSVLPNDDEPLPSLSLGATTSMAGYGLGLRLIDGGGQLFGGEQDMRLMGSITRPLK